MEVVMKRSPESNGWEIENGKLHSKLAIKDPTLTNKSF